MSAVISSTHESHADHTVTSHRVCSSVAGCFTGLQRQCCSPANHQLRFQLKHRRKPQEGDLKDDTAPAHFHHASPLRSLLSADTKPRAELLTGGGKVVLARLLLYTAGCEQAGCGGWSSPAGHVSPPHLLQWCSTITFFLGGGQLCTRYTSGLSLSFWQVPANELGQSPVLRSRKL